MTANSGNVERRTGPTAIAEWIIFCTAATFGVVIFFFVMAVVGLL